jgi:hypothetical protein
LRVDFKNLTKGQKSGYVHSKNYPYLKRDSWYFMITDTTLTGLGAIEKLHITEDHYEKEFKERVSRPGQITFIAVLMNDSYKGLDTKAVVAVQVVEEAKNRKTISYLKEDIRAIKEANMLQSALDMGNEDTDEDEDDDVDEGLELMNKLKAAGLKDAIPVRKED